MRNKGRSVGLRASVCFTLGDRKKITVLQKPFRRLAFLTQLQQASL